MYLVESKGGAIVCMLFSLFFLGTWPAVMNLLERRGRLPQHTYLDYTIANFLAAVIIAFTFGQMGTEGPNFLSQLSQVCAVCILFLPWSLSREGSMHLSLHISVFKLHLAWNVRFILDNPLFRWCFKSCENQGCQNRDFASVQKRIAKSQLKLKDFTQLLLYNQYKKL